MTGTDPHRRLLELLVRAPRGSRRDGLFATWLVCRVATDLALDPPLPERASRRRIAALERRCTSLTLPAPVRRALPAALAGLREGGPAGAGDVLTQLAAPIGDGCGPEAAAAVMEAAARLRHDAPPPGRGSGASGTASGRG